MGVMLLPAWLLVLSTIPLTALADGSMVVPWLSGNFSTSDLLPRDPAQGARTECPWDANGMVVFPTVSGDDITLGTNTVYLLSHSVTIPGTLTIPASSSLVFADTTLHLTATSILVQGTLRIGSSTCRISSTTQHTITLTGSRTDAANTTVGHKGIVVNGTDAVIEIYGHLYQPSWTRLAATAASSATELYLQECVEWPVNSKLVVTTTHRVDWRKHNQNEEVTVAGVSCETIDYLEDGQSSHRFGKVTLSQPLLHKHYAARHEYQAEVGLLSRSVLIQGDADSPWTDPQPSGTICGDSRVADVPCNGYYLTGHGGHVIVMGGAKGHFSAAEFYRMGQTNVIGKYPVHLHLLGAAGNASFVSDCSVHESYYRGVVVHGTNGTRVTRNVAYDVIGHTYYMESGNEENNEISYNLGAHVHTIGHFFEFAGQEIKTSFTAADLGGAAIPADGAASAFYISNMHNNITGNAAVGGFTGFAMVEFPYVIGEWPSDVAPDPDFSPRSRPNLPNGFYGNSVRSCCWFWDMAPAFYLGGVLAAVDWPAGRDGELMYMPGRAFGTIKVDGVKDTLTRKPVTDDGEDAWLTFVNSKASLANVGGGDWNIRSKWYNMDVVDLGERSFNAFGSVAFININVRCRTDNGLNLVPTPPAVKQTEKIWEQFRFQMFRAYDTGQKHVLDNWQISGCGTPDEPFSNTWRRAQMWSIPHGVNVGQNQLAMRNVTYLEEPNPLKLISMDVGSEDTFGAYYGTFFDADGSLTMRRTDACRPTVVGAAGMVRATSDPAWADNNKQEQRPANLWYKLTGLDDGGARGGNESDARCDLLDDTEYCMWACDQGSIQVGSMEVVRNGEVDGDGALDKNGDPLDNNGEALSTKDGWGYLAHFGDRLEDGVEMGGDPAIVGPYDHVHRGGWFLQFWEQADDASTWSSPRTLVVRRVQVKEGSTLLFAVAYPAGTTFTITQRVSWSTTETFTAASSLAELRADTTGLLYYFDAPYLYLKARHFPSGSYEDFGEDGLLIPGRNKEFTDSYFVTATWHADTGCGASDWCRAATNQPPPATAGEIAGQSPPLPCIPGTAGRWYVRSNAPQTEDVAARAWDPDARFTAHACNESRAWDALLDILEAGGGDTGGLGKRMVVGEAEVWVCIKEHPCPQAAGLQGSSGMCYVYHEQEQRFLPWGTMDELNLVS